MTPLEMFKHCNTALIALSGIVSDELNEADKGKADPWRARHAASALASIVQIREAAKEKL
jgi:hypothetical protein